MGQDPDISKAKGKAETYAYKYFLGKFFMIPMVDGLDPDQQGNQQYQSSSHDKSTKEKPEVVNKAIVANNSVESERKSITDKAIKKNDGW
jgi:hypothetical protein